MPRQATLDAALCGEGFLGLHLMRFALMEAHLAREEVLGFLQDLADALDSLVSGLERYVASPTMPTTGAPLPRHAMLAVEHGIVVHRASLEWARSAMAALAEPSLAKPRSQGAQLSRALEPGQPRARASRYSLAAAVMRAAAPGTPFQCVCR